MARPALACPIPTRRAVTNPLPNAVPARNLRAAIGIKDRAQRCQRIAPWPVIHVHPPSLRLNQSSAPKLRQVVADGRFGQPHSGREITAALLLLSGTEQQRHELYANRVGQRLESQCDLQCGPIVYHARSHRRRTPRGNEVDHSQRLWHTTILTDTLTYIKKVGTMEPYYFDICLK